MQKVFARCDKSVVRVRDVFWGHRLIIKSLTLKPEFHNLHWLAP